MSAHEVGWVFRHSPYKGAAFAVHLAIADSVNDQHGYELWMRQNVLASKARTTRQTVQPILDRLIEDGFLQLIQRGKGGANRYRFLAPDVPEVFGHGPPKEGVATDDTQAELGVTPGDRGGVASDDTEPKVSKPKVRAMPVPVPFVVTDEMRSWLASNHIDVDIEEETNQFCDYWTSKGERRVVWEASWRQWMRNTKKWGRQSTFNGRVVDELVAPE